MNSHWYFYKEGEQRGPFDWEELNRQAEGGVFGPHDLVWTEGMENWVRADQIEGLFAAPQPPPFPDPPSSPEPTYQSRGQGIYQTTPARKKSKGGLIALILILVVLVLGGGFMIINLFVLNGNDIAVLLPEEDEGNGVAEPGANSGLTASADTSGLWIPPVEAYGDPGRLPKAGEVPYPPYPGALVFSYQEPSDGQGSWDIIAYLFLLAPDPMDTVYEFYKGHLGHLDGWNVRETLNSFEIWQGGEGDYMDAWGYLIPAVLIMEPLDNHAGLMPGAQSQIIVVYNPN